MGSGIGMGRRWDILLYILRTVEGLRRRVLLGQGCRRDGLVYLVRGLGSQTRTLVWVKHGCAGHGQQARVSKVNILLICY